VPHASPLGSQEDSEPAGLRPPGVGSGQGPLQEVGAAGWQGAAEGGFGRCGLAVPLCRMRPDSAPGDLHNVPTRQPALPCASLLPPQCERFPEALALAAARLRTAEERAGGRLDAQQRWRLLQAAQLGREPQEGPAPEPDKPAAAEDGPAGGPGCEEPGGEGGAGEAGPLAGEAGPLAGEAGPLAGEAGPLAGEAGPLAGEAGPPPLPACFEGPLRHCLWGGVQALMAQGGGSADEAAALARDLPGPLAAQLEGGGPDAEGRSRSGLAALLAALAERGGLAVRAAPGARPR
jgi:hypothetical protein